MSSRLVRLHRVPFALLLFFFQFGGEAAKLKEKEGLERRPKSGS
jgi:hypothetical protein